MELEVSYLSAIGALLYLAQCTRSDISFIVNLLARYSSASIRHCYIKYIFRYLKGTSDIGLFYLYASQNGINPHELQSYAYLVGYTDAVICLIRTRHVPKLACLYYWEYDDILEVYETDLSCHFFESCRTHCPSRGHL